MLVGGRDLAPFITQREKPSLHHHHTGSGESRSLSESEPCRLCQAAHALPHPRDSAGLHSQGGRQSRNKLGELDFHFPPSALSFSCHHIRKSAPSSFLCRAQTEAPQPHLRLASERHLKQAGFHPQGRVFSIHQVLEPNPRSTLPWMDTGLENNDGYEQIQQGCPAGMPHTEHAGATELWVHGSVSCSLGVVISGEGSPVFAHRKLRFRERDPRNPTVTGFPTTITKDNRGAPSHLQAPP